MVKDYYRILGLANNAEDVVIHAAFKLLAQKYHPDKWLEEKEAANRRMKEINEAHNTLSDPLRKAKYDRRHGSNDPASDFYRVLGVLDNADEYLIQAAHKALLKKYRNLPSHDLHENRLEQINTAYQILADSSKRRIYDIKRENESFLFQENSMSGFSLRRIYLSYFVGFYIVLGLIAAIALLIHYYAN
ncbi:DnaJ domain-containing protein [Candidatus Methylobacter oryzae]|uniref:J domain-containing protein n=1 Tax=Candidatus Methylobacter oryzae TaxID=2497749 RepID=A0ABY3CGC4_9GAMM|nr:DnaJ domain-containing protein [Candidatus Methylobacter oryzae]TRX02950.1 hypothetical protein EKO24_001300 [Candidatus Methylobacter oryzae]